MSAPGRRLRAAVVAVPAVLVVPLVLGLAAPSPDAAVAVPWPSERPAFAAPAARPSLPARRPARVLARLDRRLTAMQRLVVGHERTRARLAGWLGCVRPVAVDQAGDPRHGWGFEYDERDGTGLDTRTALVPHRSAGRPDLLLLRFGREPGCTSSAPDPNGTGADARLAARAGTRAATDRATSRRRHAPSLRRVERRTARLLARLERLERAFDRFDEWESCLSWVPVTEFGHTDQHLGFRYDGGRAGMAYVSAIDVDDSEWDDPDYELLAFVGADRPFGPRECGHEPGESVDRRGLVAATGTPRRRRPESRSDRIADVRRDLRGAREDLEDLVEPVEEFVQFDECMFTVGVRNAGGASRGYRFRTPSGALVRRSALAFDMTGLRLPQMDLMAFPGEEPPQIECNEDAAGASTDE